MPLQGVTEDSWHVYVLDEPTEMQHLQIGLAEFSAAELADYRRVIKEFDMWQEAIFSRHMKYKQEQRGKYP